MGIASFVVSILAIILCLIPVVGMLFALIALILATIAMCRKKNKEVHRGLKTAGLVISIIAMLISTLFTVPTLMGAYFVFKNSQTMIDAANNATLLADITDVREECTLAWITAATENKGIAIDENGEVVTAEYYYNCIETKGFGTKKELMKKYVITVSQTNGSPTVEYNMP